MCAKNQKTVKNVNTDIESKSKLALDKFPDADDNDQESKSSEEKQISENPFESLTLKSGEVISFHKKG
ncbi:MAG: hypothetical protein H0X62_14255 [Bacteroidetes bacterium]|nr:hypothetical protein [Bacteroidota bacterium]